METITINGTEYQLDIEKAKEQGLLKKKDKKPRSWEEHVQMYYMQDITRGFSATNFDVCNPRPYYNRFTTANKAKAFCALGKLIQLKDAWVGGDWRPDWTSDKEYKWVIQYDSNDVHIYPSFVVSRPLSFPTEEMATDFLNTFRNLIEQAKMFL